MIFNFCRKNKKSEYYNPIEIQNELNDKFGYKYKIISKDEQYYISCLINRANLNNNELAHCNYCTCDNNSYIKCKYCLDIISKSDNKHFIQHMLNNSNCLDNIDNMNVNNFYRKVELLYEKKINVILLYNIFILKGCIKYFHTEHVLIK